MTSGEFDVTIDAPVDRVWPWVADLGKHAEWCRPQERFALRAQDKNGSYANTFTLEPDGQSTKVTFRLDFLEMNGMSALLVPLAFPLIGKKDIRARMGLLKTKVEASRP